MIEAVLPEGSGAIVVHRALEGALPEYRVTGYDPRLTFLPPLLYRYCPPRAVRAVHTVPDYGLFVARDDTPLLLTFHNYVMDRFMRTYSGPLQRLHYSTDLRYFTRRSLAMAAGVTAVSQFTADLVRRELGYGKAIEVIPNGVDEALFAPRREPRSGEVRVLFSGNLSLRKGAHWLEGIARRLAPGVQLYCAAGLRGGGRRLSGTIRFLGSVPYRQMPELYNSMDVLLMPTVREGHSLAVLEAMACGLPVVATDISSLPEQVHHGHGGLLCPLGDEQAFAEAVNHLAASRALRQKMGDYNRALVESRFTLREMVAAYARLFDRLA